ENPTVDEAESAYGRAEHLMVTGDSTGAAEGFKSLARQYPSSPLASRALYAAGWIYENRLYNRDSAISSYTQLLALYPGSPYSARVAPKIAEVNLHQKQVAAAADSAARRLNQNAAMAADSAARRLNGNTAPAVSDSLHKRNDVVPPNPSTAPDDSTELRKIRPPNPRTAPGKEGTIPR
ncbi:MAG TPA: tetratricopeptide repeat protein, partial [Bacteroidota bacterium]|nr:tetratricopeptide repeat protein [Bacteroidota bacterium]